MLSDAVPPIRSNPKSSVARRVRFPKFGMAMVVDQRVHPQQPIRRKSLVHTRTSIWRSMSITWTSPSGAASAIPGSKSIPLNRTERYVHCTKRMNDATARVSYCSRRIDDNVSERDLVPKVARGLLTNRLPLHKAKLPCIYNIRCADAKTKELPAPGDHLEGHGEFWLSREPTI